MDNFATLDDIFTDSVFQEMFAQLKPVKVERVNPEVEKFQELMDWVRENGREPLASGNMTEILKHRYLKGLRDKSRSDYENRRAICLPYDELGLLGECHE